MNKVTFIMPVHKFDDEVKTYMTKAFESVKNLEGTDGCEFVIAGSDESVIPTQELYNEVGVGLDLTVVTDSNTDFFTLVNKAVYQCSTPYFSVIEFDDVYNPKWLVNFNEYSEEYEASAYLPITQLVNAENGNFAGFVNEIVWASSFANEYGFIDLDCLEYYRDFNLTGAFIKTEDFINVGGLKPSLSIASWYEFTMRLCFNEKKAYVIPKTGYFHTVGRKGSYMVETAESITQEYGAWLIDTATKEYQYKEEREIKYDPNENKEENKDVEEK
jgi:hypothetical protein